MQANSLRKYGHPPFSVLVVHGGPGAPGSIAPVARELADELGVLEPLMTTPSLEGQVEDLRTIIERDGDPPVAIVGASWGAMLGLIFAARYPELVRKLVMVGSGVYEARYAVEIDRTRLERLSDEERRHLATLETALDDADVADKDALVAQIGLIMNRADTYDPLSPEPEEMQVSYECFQRVWQEASDLRARGGFLELGRRIQCPVVAIHGDYDPHPAEGIREPLTPILRDFRFILLEHCGHEPWRERAARDPFFALLRAELRS
jgi:pimeloyl-ACP methyl ester carboxylesterase